MFFKGGRKVPEDENVKGEYWTKESIALMKKLGWEQVGPSNFDIKCTKHVAARKGKKHGIDSVFKYYDPFLQQQIYINVESKNRKWSGINDKSIKDWINQVAGVMECSSLAPELHSLSVNNIINSLVLCWCNDQQYDHEKYQEYLKKISFRKKDCDYNVFIASNRDILKWCSLIEAMDQMKRDFVKFNIVYPTLTGNNTTDLVRSQHLTLFLLYSKYIFATADVKKEYYNSSHIIKQNIVFNFDNISVESLLVMYDAFKQYQLQNADEYVIYLHEKKEDVRIYIEEFKRKVQSQYNEIIRLQDSTETLPEITFKYLNSFDGVSNVPYSILGLNEED